MFFWKIGTRYKVFFTSSQLNSFITYLVLKFVFVFNVLASVGLDIQYFEKRYCAKRYCAKRYCAKRYCVKLDEMTVEDINRYRPTIIYFFRLISLFYKSKVVKKKKMFKLVTITLIALHGAFAATDCYSNTRKGENVCMSANEAGEPCAWCHSASSGDSCMKQSDAEGLPTSVFQCKYQANTEPAILGKKNLFINYNSFCFKF